MADWALLIFLVLVAIQVWQHQRFHNIEDWPSVPARDVVSRGELRTRMVSGEDGIREVPLDLRSVEYRYTVHGREYIGRRATPNQWALSDPVEGKDWVAYYNPSAPRVAVLVQEPHEGNDGLVLVSVIFGLVAMYCYWIRWGDDIELFFEARRKRAAQAAENRG